MKSVNQSEKSLTQGQDILKALFSKHQETALNTTVQKNLDELFFKLSSIENYMKQINESGFISPQKEENTGCPALEENLNLKEDIESVASKYSAKNGDLGIRVANGFVEEKNVIIFKILNKIRISHHL